MLVIANFENGTRFTGGLVYDERVQTSQNIASRVMPLMTEMPVERRSVRFLLSQLSSIRTSLMPRLEHITRFFSTDEAVQVARAL